MTTFSQTYSALVSTDISTDIPSRLIGRARIAAKHWLFAPCSPRPLRVLTIGVAAVLLFKQASVLSYLDDLFGERGIVQGAVTDTLIGLPAVPRAWWVGQVSPAWISPSLALHALFLAYMGATLMMLLGVARRTAAVATWLLHTAFLSAGFAHSYGADFFIQTYLFLIVLMQFSIARRPADAGPAGPEMVLHRVLQIFLALMYCTSGLSKALPTLLVDSRADPSQWWTGMAIVRGLLRPDMGQFDFSWLPHSIWLAKMICYGTLAAEIFFPLLLLSRRTRKPAVLALIAMHGGIGVCMGLHAFAALQITALTAAYLVRNSTK